MPLGYNYHTLIILYSTPSLNSGLFWSPAVLFMLPRNLSGNRNSNPGNDVTESTRVEGRVLGRQVNSTDPLLGPPSLQGCQLPPWSKNTALVPFRGSQEETPFSLLPLCTSKYDHLHSLIWPSQWPWVGGASWEENSTMFIVNIMIQRWPLV